MLQVEPLGLASRWKPGGVCALGGGQVAMGLDTVGKILIREEVELWL